MARIDVPIRATNCNHLACFDAKVWFMINEQTPAFTCPICSKVIKFDDLIVDQYAFPASYYPSSKEPRPLTIPAATADTSKM